MVGKTDSRLSWEERKPVIDGYMRLAAAIVESGKKSGDRVFLKSAWCKALEEGVAEWANMNMKDMPNVSQYI